MIECEVFLTDIDTMGFTDIFRISAIKADNARFESELKRTQEELEILKRTHAGLRTLFKELGGGDALKMREAIATYENQAAALRDDITGLQDAYAQAEQELAAKRGEIIGLDDELLLESFALYRPKFSFTHSVQYKDHLEVVRER